MFYGREHVQMGCLGNILWFVLGGFVSGMAWIVAGLLWCITIVGIPIGVQCFKLAGLSFLPFGKEVRYEGGGVSFIVNVLWFLFSGLELALLNALLGLVCYITVIGIPFGVQYFKIAKLSLAPFGAVVR